MYINITDTNERWNINGPVTSDDFIVDIIIVCLTFLFRADIRIWKRILVKNYVCKKSKQNGAKRELRKGTIYIEICLTGSWLYYYCSGIGELLIGGCYGGFSGC